MDWLLVRCWYEYCGAVNGRNDLDACWLIAHDARTPLSPAGNVKKRVACALDPKIIPDNIACRGKGGALDLLCWVGSQTAVEKVKRKQLQRTGPQVFAPSQSSV